MHMIALDLALFGGFIGLSIGLIIFRRFHQYETLIKPEDLGPTAWGLYGPAAEKTAPVIVNSRTESK